MEKFMTENEAKLHRAALLDFLQNCGIYINVICTPSHATKAKVVYTWEVLINPNGSNFEEILDSDNDSYRTYTQALDAALESAVKYRTPNILNPLQI